MTYLARVPHQPSRTLCLFTLAAALVAPACGNGGESSNASRARVQQEASKSTPSLFEAAKLLKLVDWNADGWLCPSVHEEGSYQDPWTVDAGTIHRIFDPVAGKNGDTCRVTVDLDVPPGYQVRLPDATINVEATNGGALSRAYSFEGGARVGPRSDTSAFDFIQDAQNEGWSDTCGTSHRTTMVAEMAAVLPKSSAQVSLLAVGVSFGALRVCGESAPQKPEEAGLGQACAPGWACKAPLVCRVVDEATLEGTCAEPDPGVPVSSNECGGSSNLRCRDANETCVYSWQGDLDAGRTGRCMPSFLSEDQPCEQDTTEVPVRVCQQGLRCVITNDQVRLNDGPTTYVRRCRAVNGQNGAHCAVDRDCNAGLYCDGYHRCSTRSDTGSDGDSCTLDLDCAEGLFCTRGGAVTRTGICRAEPDPVTPDPSEESKDD